MCKLEIILEEYLQELNADKTVYNPFNLVILERGWN